MNEPGPNDLPRPRYWGDVALGWLNRVAYYGYARMSGWLRGWKMVSLFGRLWGIPNVGAKAAPRADQQGLRLLIIRNDALGDLLLTLPFIMALRDAFPTAHLTLLVGTAWRPLAKKIKGVDEVLGVSFPPGKWSAIANLFRVMRFSRTKLRPRHFHWAICPRWDADFTEAFLLAFFSGAPVRIAFSEQSTAWRRQSNAGTDRFYTWVLQDEGVRHESERSLRFLRLAGLGSDDSSSAAVDAAMTALAEVAPVNQTVLPTRAPVVAVFPGVAHDVKQWPVSSFVAAARQLLAETKVVFVVLGSKNEEAKCREFCAALGENAMNLCGGVGVGDLPDVLRQSAVVWSCDSGGAHLAGLLNVPVVVIFSQPPSYDSSELLSPQRFGPLGRHVTILQPAEAGTGDLSSTAPPIARVAVADVVHALLQALKRQVFVNPA